MGIFRQFPYSNFHEMNLDWVISEIKKLIGEWSSFNKDFDNWKHEVEAFMAWVKEMDISEEVKTAIEEMFDSGELVSIFAEVLNIQKGNFIALLQKHIVTHFNTRYKTANYLDNDYNQIQSFTSDGTYFYCMGYCMGNPDDEYIVIWKYNADFTSVIRTAKIPCNHGNDCTIYNGDLVITNDNSELIFVNTTTLEIIEVVDLATVNNIEITSPINNICTVNNLIYCGNRNVWYVVNENSQIINTIPLTYPSDYPVAVQSMCFYNGSILRMAFPNMLMVYDLDGNLKNIYNIGSVTQYNIIGEIESITVFNDVLYVTASIWAGFPTGTMITQYFTVDLKHGEPDTNTDIHYGPYSAVDIYVDPTYTGNDSDGTEAKPYQSLSWACNIAKALYNNIRPIRLRLMNDIEEFVCLPALNSVTLYGNNHKCYGINIDGGNSIFISDLHLYADTKFNYEAYATLGALMKAGNCSNLTYYNCNLDANNNEISIFRIESTTIRIQEWHILNAVTKGLALRSNLTLGYIENASNLIPLCDINYDTIIFNRNFLSPINFSYLSQNCFVLAELLYEASADIPDGEIPLVNNTNALTRYEFLAINVYVPGCGSRTFIIPTQNTTSQITGSYFEDNAYYNYYFTFTQINDNTGLSLTHGHEGSRAPVIRRIYGLM